MTLDHDFLVAGNPGPMEHDGRPAACKALNSFPPTTLPRPEPTTQKTDTSSGMGSHTTHISVVDAEGRAVSLTETMGLYFGSAVYENGVFLNSAAMNFTGPDKRPVADRRASRRTPRSSTAPTLVLEDGTVRLVVGELSDAADLVVFDLDRIDDPATFRAPHQLAKGMVPVLVNGHLAIHEGTTTGIRAGTVLSRGDVTR